MSTRRRLGSTYRLQLNGIGFAGATELVAFLHELGVETCYVSPVSRATSHSSHGYDVVDPTVLDPELGTPAQFEQLLTALSGRGMGLLVDIVPNHMAASTENPFFADMLRLGPASRYARYFDVAWDEQDGKILLPVLGRPLADVLASAELQVAAAGAGEAVITYFDHTFPIAPGSDDATTADLADLLSRQHYRLTDWRAANQEVNYRRFFDINGLIGVRQEDPAVFAGTHSLVVSLAADPRIAGLRVDHVDGLADPADYLAMLRTAIAVTAPSPVVVVEKILEPDELLPDWPVEGTTGYEFAAAVIGLFVDEQGASALVGAAATATNDHRSFADRAAAAKRNAVETLFPHQRDQVAVDFLAAMSAAASAGAVSMPDVSAAVTALTVRLEVYRTYRRAEVGASGPDLDRIRVAADRARSGLSASEGRALDAVVAIVSGELGLDSPSWRAVSAWQQLTGPVAAKGVEDTALYDSGRLLAAADVGSDPDRPALSVGGFHAVMTQRARYGRFALSATSTHDSKRSHDVRCRLAVLSEWASGWEATVTSLDRAALSMADSMLPDAVDRRYVYETLVGAWPVSGRVGDAFVDRIDEHLVKATREAKRHSGWIDPDIAYEDTLGDFARAIVAGEWAQCRPLVEAAVAEVECAGATNSLASVVLKITAPGVPDIYQGDDSWLLRLVDPDNRSPLDYGGHAELLSSLPNWSDDDDHHDEVAPLLADWRTGAVKQFVVRNALRARRGAAEIFAEGRYVPLEVTGQHRGHAVAFARVHEGRWTLTVVPRGAYTLTGPGSFPLGAAAWTDAEIVLPSASPQSFTDVFTGRRVSVAADRLPLAALQATLPVALLIGG